MINDSNNAWQERTRLLVEDEGLDKLRNSCVAVVGLGGVGAYAAEMVARAGVGRMILVDSDSVTLTNKNRQLLAMDSTLGKSKVDLMASRLKDINPLLELILINKYFNSDSAEELFRTLSTADFLIDAIDTLSPKIILIKMCVENKLPLVSSMGSGAKFDATKVRVTDLSKSFNCPLAFILRKRLRKEGISKGFKVVFSEELPQKDAIIPIEDEQNKKSQVGSISYLPAVFGCVCAQTAILHILKIGI